MSFAPTSSSRPQSRPNDLRQTEESRTYDSTPTERVNNSSAAKSEPPANPSRFESKGGSDSDGNHWSSFGAPELQQPQVREAVAKAHDAAAIARDSKAASHERAAKAAEVTAERFAVTDNDDSSTMADLSATKAAADTAKKKLDSFASTSESEPNPQTESVATAAPTTSESTPPRFGVDSQNGKYLGTPPEELPEPTQVFENIVFGRSQRPDPELEDLPENVVRDLEFGQQFGASVISNGIVFGLGSNVDELAAQIAPPALKYPVALAGKVALGRAVNPIAQEGSDIYSDFRGEPNVVPGPGWVSVENLGDVVPSATSIVAGEAGKMGTKAALLGTASAIGISIPEPITTIVGLAGAIYVGSKVFVATDNLLPDVLPKEHFGEPEPPVVPPSFDEYKTVLDRFAPVDSDEEPVAQPNDGEAFPLVSEVESPSLVSILVEVPSRIIDWVEDTAGSLARVGQYLTDRFKDTSPVVVDSETVPRVTAQEPIPYGEDNIAVPVFSSVRAPAQDEVFVAEEGSDSEPMLIGGIPADCLIELWMAPFVMRLLALGETDLCEFNDWEPAELEKYLSVLESDVAAESEAPTIPMVGSLVQADQFDIIKEEEQLPDGHFWMM
jgi:hypothetical protein